MGVLSLWQILSSTGHPVTLESLENKILAVDVSIWMNQAVKGVRDRRGPSFRVSEAHLLVLFHRICKLLHYKIKPIFVFDGAPPALKQRVLERRRNIRAQAQNKAQNLSKKLLENLAQQHAVGTVLEGKGRVRKMMESAEPAEDDIFALPPPPAEVVIDGPSTSEQRFSFSDADSSESDDEFVSVSASNRLNLEKLDIASKDFQSLPPEIRHEILVEMQESRRRPSWKHVNQLPQDSDQFSSFQIHRLLTRSHVQRSLDQSAREMNSRRTGALCEQLSKGLPSDKTFDVHARRIASEDASHYVLLKKKRPGSSTVNGENLTPQDTNLAALHPGLPDAVIRVLEGKIATTKPVFSIMDADDEVEIPGCTASTSSTSDGSFFEAYSNSGSVTTDSVVVKQIEIDAVCALSKDENVKNGEHDARKTDGTGISNGILEKPDIIFEKSITIADTFGYSLHSEQNSEPVMNLAQESASSAMISDIFSEFTSDGMNDLSLNVASLPDIVIESSDSEDDFVDVVPEDTHFANISPVYVAEMENRQLELTVDVEDDRSADLNDLDSGLFESVDRSEEQFSAEIPVIDLEEDNDSQPELTVEELETLQEHLETEGHLLRNERKREERHGMSVTQQMLSECQELLQLFGIPFVHSPGEAEAQCAYMDSTKLTHGTITDDSDVWLFGGRKVYKHFFNQKRFVECFSIDDIEKQLGLTREKAIALALLTGSDYTEGLENIGGVRALEIMAEFGGTGLDSIRSFREWWNNMEIRKEKGDIRPENKLRSSLMDVKLPESFPNELVIKAYLEPDVDTSQDKFTWGMPALDLLREYARKRFGWQQQKTDEILLPIIKRMNMRETQTHLESFFKVTQLKRTKSVLHSRRLGQAIEKIKNAGELSAELEESPAGSSEPKDVSEKHVRRKQPARGKPVSEKVDEESGYFTSTSEQPSKRGLGRQSKGNTGPKRPKVARPPTSASSSD